MSATPEPEVRVAAVTTGWPEVELLACVGCGVLLWDIDAHYTHAHPLYAPHPTPTGEMAEQHVRPPVRRPAPRLADRPSGRHRVLP